MIMSEALDKLVKKQPAVSAGPYGLDEDDIRAFAQDYLIALSRQAFGTLAKREQDVLTFHLLSRTKKLAALTNYEWANLLKISEGRVRALRADAALRFPTRSHEEALFQIAVEFQKAGKSCLEYVKEHGRVRMLLDDPALHRELEFAIRGLGGIPDSSFNRNILEVPATTFVAVFLKSFPKHEKQFEEAFKKLAEKDKQFEGFVDKTKSLGERFESAWEAHAGKREALVGVASAIITILTGA